MNIASIIESEANVQIVVTLSDLTEFALAVATEVMAAKEEYRYLTPDDVSEMLGVSKNTLWRWEKEKYLIPFKIGRKSRYKQSDIDKIMEGRG